MASLQEVLENYAPVYIVGSIATQLSSGFLSLERSSMFLSWFENLTSFASPPEALESYVPVFVAG